MKREVIGIILSGIGIVDTLILMDATFNNSGVCEETTPILGYPVDCGYILTTEYAKVFTIPLSVWGFLFYLGMFILFNMYNEKRQYLSHPLLAGGITGFLASSYFVYLQLVIIEAICLYCMGSALTSTSIFILMILSYNKLRSQS
ncbi:MAG: vitamin K epoxide reductase family protein [Candidatus Heimdallarchaeota archaeon]|nr:vitamin K epoxide reductase family protein [Candidatus Heimdallarchaeota archaeon]